MSFELFPTIVVDPTTDKTFRQSKRAERHGMRKYRRARRIVPGVWYTYRNTFLGYPSDFHKLHSVQSEMQKANR